MEQPKAFGCSIFSALFFLNRVFFAEMASLEAALSPIRDQHCPFEERDVADEVALELSRVKVDSSTGESPPSTPDGDEIEQPDTQRSCDSVKVEIKRAQTIGDYEVVKTIGVGAYSKVKLVQHTTTRQQFAIKIMSKLPDHPFQPANEILAMQKVHSHPNVVTLHRVLASNSRLFLVLDYACQGDLFEMIVQSEKKHLDETTARHLFSQLINAVEFMHQNGVCHRDIKAENCLIGENSTLMLSDFGFAKIFQPWERPQSTRRCGTANYIAPEMLELPVMGPFDPFKTDIWSCGVLLFFMLTGHLPFDSSRSNNIYLKIQACKPSFPSHVSADATSLILSILTPNPSARATIASIREHQWMVQQGG
eukprot:c9343_g1_i1.p1 GENE.c9343_g1_i1~~c9343_g1_i1.p1  ORF type:complete len:365 (+),score=60.18 c9343_g1_i1:1398-2492(+)